MRIVFVEAGSYALVTISHPKSQQNHLHRQTSSSRKDSSAPHRSRRPRPPCYRSAAVAISPSLRFWQQPMSSPPTLPISSQQQTSSYPSEPLLATPAFRSFINRLASSVRQGFSQRRPWMELVDRSSFSRPDSLTDAASRVRKNFSYFRVNYVSLIALVLAFSLLSHPFSLLVLLCLLGAWLFLYTFRPSDQPLILLGRTFSDRETLGILVVSTVVVIFLTSVGSLLISALMVGLASVCAHGAFRDPEDLFLDDQEPASAGFLSFIGTAASSAAAAAPAVAARV
ncbi:PRA1 protein B3 [Ancistrocladus abbreviatus]